jgi:hypothetical protein
MKVVVLGATGRVAGMALPLLTASPAVDEVVAAGRDVGSLRARLAELGVTASVARADASDASAVEAVAAGADVVLNLAGRDDITPLSAAAGALSAGCHYVDIGASPTAVIELLGRSGEFESASLTCIPSMGTAPGVAGLLGVHAARHLDACHAVTVNLGVPFLRWGDPGGIADGLVRGEPLPQTHVALVAWFVRSAPVVRDGRLEWVRPNESVVTAVAPDGRGYDMMPICSTEALTVPRALPDVARVESLAALWPIEAMDLIAAQPLDADIEDSTRSVIAALAAWDRTRLRPPSDYPDVVFWAQADGQLDGRDCSVRCTRRVPVTTAGVAVTAALLLGTDASLPRGAHPPEACFEVTDFLGRTAAIEHLDIDGPWVDVMIAEH